MLRATVIFFYFSLLPTVPGFAQQSKVAQIDALYKNAITLLRDRKIFDANREFEKVLSLDSNHVESLYNLGKINEVLDDSSTAVKFFLRGVHLNDPRAKKELVGRYKYKVTYADTMQVIAPSISAMYSKLSKQQAGSFEELFQAIQSTTPDKRQQLQILLLWIYDVLHADSKRFFDGGYPLSNDDVFTKHIGLCDEYSNVVKAFCKSAGIPNYKVPGYVKYMNFRAGDKFTETNHAWNAVLIDSTWLLCDAFWSTVALSNERSLKPRFTKRLETKYFLARPEDFISDHLPADPVFQFSTYPIVIEAFTKTPDGIDTNLPRMKRVDYADSLEAFGKMKGRDRELKMAERAFVYNRNNPNYLIVEGYNYAADIVNSTRSTKQDLIKAKGVLTRVLGVIDRSNDNNIRALKPACETAVANITQYLAKAK